MEQLYLIERKDKELVVNKNSIAFEKDPYLNYQYYDLSNDQKLKFIHALENSYFEFSIGFNHCYALDSSLDCIALVYPPLNMADPTSIGEYKEKWMLFIEDQRKRFLELGYDVAAKRYDLIVSWFYRAFEKYNAFDGYYFFTISCDPNSRGKGLASKLMETMAKKFDEQQKKCYLECTNDLLIPFYSKHGFVTLSREQLPKSDDDTIPDNEIPYVTFMERLPIVLQTRSD